jgi:DNA-binding transcriptional MerR regulator
VLLLNSGDVHKITGVPMATIDAWCREGRVKPANEGNGTGRQRVFSLMQVIGLAVVAELRKQERGCPPVYVGKIVDAFASMDETELQKRFAEGKTHLVMIHHGAPLLSGKQYDWLDVKSIHQNVTKAAKAMEAKS